ncbi:MAG: hypothetical protein QNJ47_17230 [Nostocaceae cyanobacterium]|nr:hypothetical protein [Nostocaceae cyanobacterium]
MSISHEIDFMVGVKAKGANIKYILIADEGYQYSNLSAIASRNSTIT